MPWDFAYPPTRAPVYHPFHKELDKYTSEAAQKRAKRSIKCLVPRESWGAVPPTSMEKLNHTAPFFHNLPPREIADHIHFTHTKTPECHSVEECSAIIKGLQEQHMSAGETDILYSFLVGGDGNVYEGRGWFTMCKVPEDFTVTVVASLEIAMIGDYSKMRPPKPMISGLKKVTEWAILNKKLDCCYNTTYNYEFFKMFFERKEYPHVPQVRPDPQAKETTSTTTNT